VAQELNDDNFEKEVLESEKPVLVDFYADWCGPCRQQAPILERWATANAARVTVAKLNVDQAGATAARYGVMSIPTLILFHGGRERARRVGVQNERALTAMLDEIGS